MSKKDIGIKVFVEIARIILGVTFIFSGFVKAVDPYGFTYKIEDYLTAFHLSPLSFLAFFASAFMCVLEFAMGACMLFGLYRKWNSRLMLLVMTFMTLLTLYLAIANPVDDCGCFGDAIIITNWQTFYKNIVLLICAVFVFIYHEHISNIFTGKTYWLAFLYIFIFIISFVFHNYLFDPVFDFRPYKIGANIPQLMSVEEGKGRQEETFLVYAKDGVEKEFTEDNYPWEDSTWVFVRMDTKIISEGEKPQITDFSIEKLVLDQRQTEDVVTTDITSDVLSDTNYVFLMVSPSLTQMSTSYLTSFEDVKNYSDYFGYKFYCLTASPTDEIIKWAKDNTINFDFCSTDGRTLKTIIRSNPGLILLKNGVVINKWADINVPEESDLKQPLNELSYGQMRDVKAEDKKNIIYISFVFLLPLLILKGLDFVLYRKRQKETNQQTEE